MLKFGNKEFNNLQEQVLENANDILEIKQSLGDALPNPIAGPQGPVGPQGPQGIPGQNVNFTVGTDLPASANNGDLHLKFNGELYKYVNSRWVLQTSLKGPQGVQGAKGLQGETGATGPQGPQGEQGVTAPIYVVRGTVSNYTQLPDPDTVDTNTAYLVGNVNTALYIYALITPVSGSRSWMNIGLFDSTINASNVNYQNDQSTLTARTVQNAITELDDNKADYSVVAKLGGNNTFTSTNQFLVRPEYSGVGLATEDEVHYAKEECLEAVSKVYDVLYETIIVSAEEDLTGTVIVMPSTIILEDSLAHTIVESIPFVLKAVKGRTWIKNQICSPLNSGNWFTQSTTGTLSEKTENSVLFTRSQTESTTNITGVYQLQSAYKILAGNKTHLKVDLTPSADCSVRLFAGVYQPNDVKIYANQKNHIETILSANSDAYPLLIITHNDPLPLGGTLLIENFKGTDLTKMFGAGNEPTTVDQFNELTRNIDLSAYDEGSFINVNISEIETTKQDTTTINTYTLTVSDLNGIGTAHDTITWDGTNRTETKVIDELDLGTPNWSKGSQNRFVTNALSSLAKKPANDTTKANIICSKFENETATNVYLNQKNNIMAINSDGTLFVYVDDVYFENTDATTFKADVSGIYLKYETTAPTSTTTLEYPLEVEFEKGGQLYIDSGVEPTITAEFAVKDWSN